MTRMYLEHFGLLAAPFSIAPDPRYLYMSDRHREALAHLLYGMESDGAFILLTGDVGTGKTTVSRCLLEQVPENINIALVLNPKLTAVELLRVICDELHIERSTAEVSVKSLVDDINHYLLATYANGKKTVVLIEEAQNLDLDVLEQLRLLTNLETNERKLLQVILLGQPEFLDVLDRPELSQLAQRITARFHLTPLSSNELEEYIGHRLAVAGCRRPLFAFGVLKQLYNYSGGVPRLINVICDRALLGAYVQGNHQVDKTTLVQAAREVLGENKAIAVNSKHNLLRPKAVIASMLLILLAAVIYYAGYFQKDIKTDAQASYKQVEPVLEIKPIVNDIEIEIQQTVKQPAHIEWPEQNLRLRSNTQAYRSLFKSWQLNYPLDSNSTPCFFAKTKGLACLQGQENIEYLRALNRPAILKLHDDFNQPQYAALLELGTGTAKIQFGEKSQTVSLEQLELYWQGDFSLLWKVPENYQDMILPWSTSKAVLWLSEAMNKIEGDVLTVASNVYNRALLERVKKFQQVQGLKSDGVVGVKTIIRINQVLGVPAPVLEPAN